MAATNRTHREAIKELKYAYCYALDYGDVDEFVELFTDSASFTIQPAGVTATGRAELRAVAERIADFDLECLTHLAFNPVIRVDGDTATGKWFSIIMLESTDGRVEWGHSRYNDAYRHVDGEWKFTETTVQRRHTIDLSGHGIEAGEASPLGSLE